MKRGRKEGRQEAGREVQKEGGKGGGKEERTKEGGMEGEKGKHDRSLARIWTLAYIGWVLKDENETE